MPVYEYRCLDCDDRFSVRRSMHDTDVATCPEGHGRVKRLLSTFAATRSGAGSPAPATIPMGGGGGCCGGGCGCG